MQWFNNLLSLFSEKIDTSVVKQKLSTNNVTENISNQELESYADDIQERVRTMVKELQALYKKYGIDFSGFNSFDSACEYLKQSIYNRSEQAYNNLIKLESAVTSEQKRHVALIRMAVTNDGKKVMELINKNPEDKNLFVKIFGEHNAAGTVNQDGVYQRLWSEMHKLSEYVLIHRNVVYH